VRPYETLFFTEPNITDEAVDAIVTKVEGAITRYGGQVEKVTRWGKRQLAYPVEKHSEGFYILIDFKGHGDALRELERFYLINQNILRFMTTSRIAIPPRVQ
jgi:small subunit ribosomal protein S6